MKRILLPLILCFCSGYLFCDVEISEVFSGGGFYSEGEAAFIEFYNNSTNRLSAGEISILVYTNENQYVELRFARREIDPDVPFLKSPGDVIEAFETFVLISRSYSNSLELLPFSSNCGIFHPQSEQKWRSAWKNGIKKIKFLKGGSVLTSTPDLDIKYEKNITNSFSIKNGKIYKTWISPGNPFLSYIFSTNLFVFPGSEAKVWIYSEENLSSKIVQIFSTKSFYVDRLNPVSEGEYYSISWRVPYGLKNGENIIFECGNLRLILRYVDLMEVSPLAGKILINEIVGDPQIDYSGGGWNGSNGGGTINSTDDWVELLNLSGTSVNISNFYFMEKTRISTTVKDFVVRTNNTAGDRSKIFISNGLMVVTPANGISQKGILFLYDSHPFKGGKLVDYVEYGMDFDGDGIYLPTLKASSIEDEALARLIQKDSNLPYHNIFRKVRASYGVENSPENGFLLFHIISNLLQVFVADKSILTDFVEVNIENVLDFERVLLKREGFCFFGEIPFVERKGGPWDNVLNVKNGVNTRIWYENSGRIISKEWLYLSENWNVSMISSDLKSVVVYPVPLKSGNKLKIANLPSGANVYFINESGYVLKNEVAKEDFIIWEDAFPKGIYTIVICYNQERVSKKILVY